MTHGSNFWVIGGEFGSMNFHKLVEGSAQVKGPFKTRKEAEDCWREVSEEHRHRAGVRFSIVEEPHRVMAQVAVIPSQGVGAKRRPMTGSAKQSSSPLPSLPRLRGRVRA